MLEASSMLFIKRSLLVCFTFFSTFCLASECCPIKFIVFDFGGVIAESNLPMLGDFVSTTLCLPKEEASKVLYAWYKSAKADVDIEEFWTSFAEEKKIELPASWIARFKVALSDSYEEIPGMLNLVCQLQKMGYRTPLLSNTTRLHAEIIRSDGLYNYFCPVLLSYAIGYKKPELEAYRILLKTLNASPSECLFVDNDEENVVAAQSLGIDSIHFISLPQLESELCRRGIFDINATRVSSSRSLGENQKLAQDF